MTRKSYRDVLTNLGKQELQRLCAKRWSITVKVAPGKIRATLSQSMQRGFGVGSMQLAKKILKERKHATST